MKKLIVFFCVQVFLFSFSVSAEDLGISVGTEVGVGNINKANGGDMWPFIKPLITYYHSFGDVDVYSELHYTFGFIKEFDDKGEKVFPQSLSFDLGVSYNLKLNNASVLTFMLENRNSEIAIAPNFGYDKIKDRITGNIRPSIKFSQRLGSGGIIAKIGFPIFYLRRSYNGDLPIVGIEIANGWKSPFGLGIGSELLTGLSPEAFHGYFEHGLIVSYDSKTVPIYTELELKIPNEVKSRGFTVTPKLYLFFNPFRFTLNCTFGNIAAKNQNGKNLNISISPTLGASYNF
jgi:hypothetical protein